MTQRRPEASSSARVVGWLALVAVATLVFVATVPQAIEVVAGWVAANVESLPWYASRLLGLLAYGALTASVVYGLALSTGLMDRLSPRVVSLSLHQELSAAAIGLTLLHGAALLLDSFVKATLLQLVTPFATEYRPAWVGIGQIALYLMVIVYGSFYVRRRIGQRAWRMLHYTTLLAFGGATVHGLMSGTDTASPLVFWSYMAASTLVVFLLAYRISTAVLRKEKRT